MSDALAALALRHGKPKARKPQCAKCRSADTEARIVVCVFEIAGGKRQRQVVSKTRSLCAECTALIFEEIAKTLPAEGALSGVVASNNERSPDG
jgi:hypothetical protein